MKPKWQYLSNAIQSRKRCALADCPLNWGPTKKFCPSRKTGRWASDRLDLFTKVFGLCYSAINLVKKKSRKRCNEFHGSHKLILTSTWKEKENNYINKIGCSPGCWKGGKAYSGCIIPSFLLQSFIQMEWKPPTFFYLQENKTIPLPLLYSHHEEAFPVSSSHRHVHTYTSIHQPGCLYVHM